MRIAPRNWARGAGYRAVIEGGGVPRTRGYESGVRRVIKSKAAEQDGWNTVELILRGSENAVHIVNGMVVNRFSDLQRFSTAENRREALSRGRIAFQAEGADVFYRSITIKPLGGDKEQSSADARNVD